MKFYNSLIKKNKPYSLCRFDVYNSYSIYKSHTITTPSQARSMIYGTGKTVPL